MRVLIIANLYPRPGHESYAAFNRQQFRALAKHHEIRVVAPVAWTQVLADRRHGIARPPAGINADGAWVDYPTFYFPPRIFRHHYGSWLAWSIRKSVHKALSGFKPDVILGSWAHPDGWVAAQVGKAIGAPVVVKIHGSDVLVAGKEARRQKALREGLDQAAAVVSVGVDLAQQLESMGIDRSKIHVVHHGVNRKLFQPGSKPEARKKLGLPPNDKVLLFIGNILRSKGADSFVDACQLLGKRGTQFHAYLVGKGRDSEAIQAIAQRQGLSERIHFVGSKPHDQLPTWYQAADLFALPSLSEGIPNVLRESLACGTPFVATNVGGIPELADPSWCQLVEPGKPRQLADAMSDMLQQPKTIDSERYGRLVLSWEESAEQLAAVLEAARDCHAPKKAPLASVEVLA